MTAGVSTDRPLHAGVSTKRSLQEDLAADAPPSREARARGRARCGAGAALNRYPLGIDLGSGMEATTATAFMDIADAAYDDDAFPFDVDRGIVFDIVAYCVYFPRAHMMRCALFKIMMHTNHKH